MTLTLPAAFPKWLVEAVAGYWPECDEDAVRREGDHWKLTGDSCRQLSKRHDAVCATEKTALHGYSADTKATRNMQLGDDLRNQATYCDSMAEQCYQKANDCEFTKLQVIGTGFALLAQLAVDALMSAPGVVKAAEDRAAAEASWTATARRYFGNIKKVGLECATKRKGLPLAKATAIGFALGGGTAAAVNAGAQYYQMQVLHHRDKMDWGMVEDAAIIGGVGGGIGARFASRFAPGINKFLGKLAAKSESNLARYSAHVTAGVLIGGAGGAAGALGGAGAGVIVTGHLPDAKELRTSVLQGFVGGSVGSATIFTHPLPPGLRARTTTDPSAKPSLPTDKQVWPKPEPTPPSTPEPAKPSLPTDKQVWPKPEPTPPSTPEPAKPSLPTDKQVWPKPEPTPPSTPEPAKPSLPTDKQVWPKPENTTPPPEDRPIPVNPHHPPPHTEEVPPAVGNPQGESPFAGHPDADILDRAVERFPEVFDRPRTLEELNQGLQTFEESFHAIRPAMSFEELHQALAPDLPLEQFRKLSPFEISLGRVHRVMRPDMPFDEFFEALQPNMSFDELMAVRDFSFQRYGLEAPPLSSEILAALDRGSTPAADETPVKPQLPPGEKTAHHPDEQVSPPHGLDGEAGPSPERSPADEHDMLPQLPTVNVALGRNLHDDLDFGFIRSKMRTSIRDISDPALGEIYRLQGFDGLPALTDSRGVDEVIAAGGREFFRGVTDPRYASEFRTGPYFPGLSAPGVITGNGTYVTTVRESALDYAEGNPEGVVRMALLPDARVSDITPLYHEQEAAIRSITNERRRLEEMEQTPEIAARIQELVDAWYVYSDLGRFAAIRGYDAYSTHGGNWGMNDRYWVILNRTALVVER